MIKSHLKSWLDARLILILFCTVELYLIQEFTFIVDRPMEAHQLLIGKLIRFGLDFLIFLIILRGFHKSIIHSVFVLQVVIYLGLTNYFLYFRRPLSLMTLTGQFDEAIFGAQTGFALISPVTVIVLLAGLIVKVLLLVSAATRTEETRSRRKGAAWSAALYGSIIIALVFKLDPLKQFETHATVSRIGAVYGYFWAWVGEYCYLKNGHLLERAIVTANAYEAKPVKIPQMSVTGDLVMFQVESLDYEIIHKRINGKELTPFLNQLTSSSVFYKVRAIHYNGSADADFSMLTGRHPSTDIVTYKILDYPYENTLPQKLRTSGYFTTAYHGIHGDFFNTKDAFTKMGFEQLSFLEDMRGQPGVEVAWWGIKDCDLFEIAGGDWREQRNFQFFITMTSHTPFNQLRPSENLFIAQPANTAERYYNSIHYADRCIADYVAGLPEETTVIIYGDHESGILQPAGELHSGTEYVPFILSKKGHDLTTVVGFSAGDPLAGDFSLLDLSHLVHTLIER